jgi:hypothetical protein
MKERTSFSTPNALGIAQGIVVGRLHNDGRLPVMVTLLVLCRRDVARGAVESPPIPPVDPSYL